MINVKKDKHELTVTKRQFDVFYKPLGYAEVKKAAKKGGKDDDTKD